VRRVAADDAAERDDACEAATLRERHCAEWKLEGPGNLHHGDGLADDTGPLELLEGALEQPVRDVAVEPADDDADRAAAAVRGAGDHAVAVRHGQLAH